MILVEEFPQYLRFESKPRVTLKRFLNVEEQQYEIYIDLSSCDEFVAATLQNTLRLQIYNTPESEQRKRVLQFDIVVSNAVSRHDTKIFFNISDKFETVLFVKVKFNFKKLVINSKTQNIDEKKEINFSDVLRVYE